MTARTAATYAISPVVAGRRRIDQLGAHAPPTGTGAACVLAHSCSEDVQAARRQWKRC